MKKEHDCSLVWVRNDLRFIDNPALLHAAERSKKVILLYVYEADELGDLSLGGASKCWLHYALADFSRQVAQHGGSLVIQRGAGDLLVAELAKSWKVDAVFWNRRYEPEAVKRDGKVKAALEDSGVEVKSFSGNVLHEPWQVMNKTGNPYKVFTPFWKTASMVAVEMLPEAKPVVEDGIEGIALEQLELLSDQGWSQQIASHWQIGAAGAEERLGGFTDGVRHYGAKRDNPSIDGTSRLSPWLHFGQVSARQVFHRFKDSGEGVHQGYLRQLYWRDFAHQLMFHFPYSMQTSLKPEYDVFPWRQDGDLLMAWQQGRTGYPIIDAGMRQLWQTGWMHNRVRMIVGSFLVKQLLQPWQAGRDWFWDTLVDADLANNVMGWQWCAGSGADAAPYFRIFNPVTQGQRFDPKGSYVREFLPELKELPDQYIHTPWELPRLELASYGVTLGKNYPEPIVELKAGRQAALEAYAEMREILQ